MMFKEKTEKLSSIIFGELSSLIDNDYVLYELPYYNNIGDLLIWEGELSFLRKIPYRMIDSCSMHTYHISRQQKISDETIILMQGGGNFGDIWRSIQEFRLDIIQRHPNNKIIIFPQTVYYKNRQLMEADANVMGQHKNLTICARDKVSYDLLKGNFSNSILLLPDMAFCIPTERLQKYARSVIDKTLFLKRKDCELQNVEYKVTNQYPLDICDWPAMEHLDIIQQGMRCMIVLRKLGISTFEDWYCKRIYKDFLIKKGIEFVSQYKEIYTTRLHVAILSILLGKPFYFFDNSYGKNSSFFNTWLSDVDGIIFKKI